MDVFKRKENTYLPHSKDQGVGFDDSSIAVESDVCIVPVQTQLAHLGHQGGGGHVHPVGSVKGNLLMNYAIVIYTCRFES